MARPKGTMKCPKGREESGHGPAGEMKLWCQIAIKLDKWLDRVCWSIQDICCSISVTDYIQLIGKKKKKKKHRKPEIFIYAVKCHFEGTF